MPPMNQLDASAAPINIFQPQPDLRPYKALLPEVSLKNLMVQPSSDAETARWIRVAKRGCLVTLQESPGSVGKIAVIGVYRLRGVSAFWRNMSRSAPAFCRRLSRNQRLIAGASAGPWKCAWKCDPPPPPPIIDCNPSLI